MPSLSLRFGDSDVEPAQSCVDEVNAGSRRRGIGTARQPANHMARCRAYVSSSVAFLRLCVSCWCSSCMAPCPMALLTWLTAVLFRGGAYMTTHQPRMLEQLAFAVLYLDQGSGREHHDAVQSHSGCLGCLSAISCRSEPSCEVIAVSSGLYKTSSRALLDQTSHHPLTHSQHSTTTLNLHSIPPSFTNHHQQSTCLPPARKTPLPSTLGL